MGFLLTSLNCLHETLISTYWAYHRMIDWGLFQRVRVYSANNVLILNYAWNWSNLECALVWNCTGMFLSEEKGRITRGNRIRHEEIYAADSLNCPQLKTAFLLYSVWPGMAQIRACVLCVWETRRCINVFRLIDWLMLLVTVDWLIIVLVSVTLLLMLLLQKLHSSRQIAHIVAYSYFFPSPISPILMSHVYCTLHI